MNKIDREKRDKFLEIYFNIFKEVTARSIGEMQRQDVAIEIDQLANCVLAAAFQMISMEYVRLDDNTDSQFIELMEDLIEHNFKQFKQFIPRDRELFQLYIKKNRGLE